MSGKTVIDTPKPFAEHADKAVKGITSLYLSTEEVLIEPDDIEVSPRIEDIIQIHMWINDKKPFFTQFYGEGA